MCTISRSLKIVRAVFRRWQTFKPFHRNVAISSLLSAASHIRSTSSPATKERFIGPWTSVPRARRRSTDPDKSATLSSPNVRVDAVAGDHTGRRGVHPTVNSRCLVGLKLRRLPNLVSVTDKAEVTRSCRGWSYYKITKC